MDKIKIILTLELYQELINYLLRRYNYQKEEIRNINPEYPSRQTDWRKNNLRTTYRIIKMILTTKKRIKQQRIEV